MPEPLRAKNVSFVLTTNLKSVFLLCQAAGRHMVPLRRGRIINVASLLTFQGGLTVPAYAAAKGGVGQLTKALANEWSAHGVGVNAIAPGYIETDMNEKLLKDPIRLRQISERIPAGRWGRPEDFAGPVVFLASKASQYVCGEVLVVDGNVILLIGVLGCSLNTLPPRHLLGHYDNASRGQQALPTPHSSSWLAHALSGTFAWRKRKEKVVFPNPYPAREVISDVLTHNSSKQLRNLT
ncbi:unnamed protein product [Cyclocybe aegerita]|uniref:2-deoxy-D-gluconate 3-dehydrogenase n=1 Tax=Cyclocybe aegerita TaxID=1973307 RepID=A0A8S0WA22_CYCAE|nr:unnamed protein product [Cyclocybe aegerita]